MNIRYLLSLLFILAFFFHCSDDGTGTAKSRATINSSAPDKITGTSVRFKGSIVFVGDYAISDHGFVWSQSPYPTLVSEGKISLGPTSVKGEYTYDVNGLEEGKTYYVRAFVTDELGNRYEGEPEDDDDLDYQGLAFSTLSLAAFDFEPKSAKAGELITIKGNNFSLIPSDNVVEFGLIKTSIEEVTASQIKVRVPFGIDEKESKIYVTVGGKTTVSYDKFTLISGEWERKEDLPSSSKFATSFTIGSNIYLVSGQDINNNYKNDVWAYNTDLDQWSAKSAFPGTARTFGVGFSINGKGYFGTGEKEGKLKDFWEYNPATDVWTPKADFAGGVRSGAIGFAIEGKAYIGLGSDGNMKKDLWQYNPSNDTWTQMTDFPGTGRFGSIVFVVGTDAYVGTGLDASGLTTNMYALNTTTNKWSTKAAFPGTARYMASSFSIDDQGFVGAGFSTKELADFWQYYPDTDKWYAASGIQGARYGAVSNSAAGRAFIGGGKSSGTEAIDFWELTIK